MTATLPRRTDEQLQAELLEAIDAGRLKPQPTADAIRTVLRIAPDRARTLRDWAKTSPPPPTAPEPTAPADLPHTDAIADDEKGFHAVETLGDVRDGKGVATGNTPGGARDAAESTTSPGTAQRWAAAAAMVATLFVAVTAFVLAYDGSRGAALDAGISPGTAGWYPACIEGVLTVAAICTVVLGGLLPWTVMLTFSGLSVGANVEHALQHGAGGWFPLLVAAVPPAALPLCVEMAIRAVRKLVGADQ